MNPCKIQIFRYSFEGVTVLSLKGKCTYYPARCKRKRSQWNTRSWLPVALSERKLLDSLLPRALPWANFLLGFQPVFAAWKPFIQDKTTEFQTKWGSGNNISHHSNGRATERHGCVVKTGTNFIRCKKNIVVLLNLCHSVNAGVHWFRESDLFVWFNLLLKQKNMIVITTNDLINENPCEAACPRSSVFFRC